MSVPASDSVDLWAARLVRLRPALERCAARLTRGGAAHSEDLVQETLTKLLAVARQEATSGPPEGRLPLRALDDVALGRYATRSLTHLYFDGCRRQREVPWPEQDGAPVVLAAPDTGERPTHDALDRARALPRAMAHCLDGRERAFLVAALEEGTAAEAQRRCGWPPGSTSNACHKLDQIRRRLLSWLERGHAT